MKIWIEQNLLAPLFLGLGLLLMITLCLTGGFAASVQGLRSGTIVLSFLWGIIALLGLAAGIGYANARRCPRCKKRLTLINEQWKDWAEKKRHHLVRCTKCGYQESESI